MRSVGFFGAVVRGFLGYAVPRLPEDRRVMGHEKPTEASRRSGPLSALHPPRQWPSEAPVARRDHAATKHLRLLDCHERVLVVVHGNLQDIVNIAALNDGIQNL